MSLLGNINLVISYYITLPQHVSAQIEPSSGRQNTREQIYSTPIDERALRMRPCLCKIRRYEEQFLFNINMSISRHIKY